MTEEDILIQLREIIAKLEERQHLIGELLVHDDPELVLLGQYQKPVVDECHALLTRLVATASAGQTRSHEFH